MLCLPTLGKPCVSTTTKKLRSPAEVVHKTRSLLLYSKNSPNLTSQMTELSSLVRELKLILYGDDDSEPSEEACAQLTQEFFKEDTFRLLVIFLPKYEDPQLALHYGRMLKECLRHQIVAGYILEPSQQRKFFDYIQHPSFDIAADAADTFKDLLTRHKSTVSESLSTNYCWFFTEFNQRLLKSANYITRRQAVKKYIVVNIGMLIFKCWLLPFVTVIGMHIARPFEFLCYDTLRQLKRQPYNSDESSKGMAEFSYYIWQLFVANKNKPPEI
ncbi:Armadillo-like helical, partial [Cynara cardunculus var. scolymus]